MEEISQSRQILPAHTLPVAFNALIGVSLSEPQYGQKWYMLYNHKNLMNKIHMHCYVCLVPQWKMTCPCSGVNYVMKNPPSFNWYTLIENMPMGGQGQALTWKLRLNMSDFKYIYNNS